MGGVVDEREDGTPDEQLLAAAAAEIRLHEDAFGEQRQREVRDQKFEAGEHFDQEELSYLKTTGRPEIIMDQVSGQVAKVTNQPVPRGIVLPNGSGADPVSAEYWQGIGRRVETLSGAEAVYKWARRHVAVMGRGFWRVRPDYYGRVTRSADGRYPLTVFQQDIRIEPILFQHAVYEDPRCRQLDFSDMLSCHITSDVDWKPLKRLHPSVPFEDAKSLLSAHGDASPGWVTERGVRIAERYWIEEAFVTLCVVNLQGVDTVVEKTEKSDYPKELIRKEHTFPIRKVKWMKYMHGVILDRADVPGRYIPVVKIVGERRIVEGKEDNRGMVRMARHPQRLVDFYEQRLASAVDLSSEGLWTGSVRAIGDRVNDYANAHKDRPGVLLYNDVDETGQPIPEPKFVTVAPAVQHLVIAAQRAGMSLRGILGAPDVAPEEQRREQSGVAIGRRQAEQAQTTSHYGDSTNAGVRQTWRIILDMGREVYSVPQILRINGKNEKDIDVLVSAGVPDEAAYQRLGIQPGQIEHMLRADVGDFDVIVAAGRAQDTQRQETVDIIKGVLPMLPPPMAVKATGTMLRNLDGAGMYELAQQLAPDDEQAMVPREEVEQLTQQAGQIIDAAKAKIQELEQQIATKRDELTAKMKMNTEDNETKLEIETRKATAEIEKARMAAMATAMRPDPVPEFSR